jgi:hypothetical protein
MQPGHGSSVCEEVVDEKNQSVNFNMINWPSSTEFRKKAPGQSAATYC